MSDRLDPLGLNTNPILRYHRLSAVGIRDLRRLLQFWSFMSSCSAAAAAATDLWFDLEADLRKLRVICVTWMEVENGAALDFGPQS